MKASAPEVFKAATNPADLANFIVNAKSILHQSNLLNGLDPRAVAGRGINVVVDTNEVVNIVIPQVQTIFKDQQEKDDYLRRIGFIVLCGCR